MARADSIIDIKVEKFADTSAAPSVIKQEKANDHSGSSQFISKFKEKNSLLVVTNNLDVKKSNFASAKYEDQSVSQDSRSENSGDEFDYSKHVLEDKSLLIKQDSSNDPNSANVFERKQPIVHPRIK